MFSTRGRGAQSPLRLDIGGGNGPEVTVVHAPEKKGVTSPGVIFFLKRSILAHPFQSHFIGARKKGSKVMCF